MSTPALPLSHRCCVEAQRDWPLQRPPQHHGDMARGSWSWLALLSEPFRMHIPPFHLLHVEDFCSVFPGTKGRRRKPAEGHASRSCCAAPKTTLCGQAVGLSSPAQPPRDLVQHTRAGVALPGRRPGGLSRSRAQAAALWWVSPRGPAPKETTAHWTPLRSDSNSSWEFPTP